MNRLRSLIPGFLILMMAGLSTWFWGIKTFPLPVVDDAAQYYTLATHLAEDHNFSLDGETPSLIREPFYPFFLALHITLFGEGFYAPVFVSQVLLIAAMAWMVYRVIVGSYPRAQRVAWGGALVVSLFPPFGLYAGRLMAEILFAALWLFSTWALIQSLSKKGKSQTIWAFGAGLTLGLAILTRSVLLFLPAFGWILGMLMNRKQWKVWTLVALTAWMTILPWMVRNSIHFDTTMITTRGGYTMLVRGLRTEHTWQETKEFLYLSTIGSTSEYVYETYYVEGGDDVILLDPVREEVFELKSQGWTDAEIDAYQMQKGLELIRQNPLHYIFYSGIEWVKLSGPHLAVYHEYVPASLPVDFGIAGLTMGFYAFAAWAFWSRARRWRGLSSVEKTILGIVLGSWIYYNGIIVCFDAIPRYNLPLFNLYFIVVGLWFASNYAQRHGNL